MEIMVEIKSPARVKDLEGKLCVLFKALMAEGFKKELFDTDRMIAVNLGREECVALVDRNDNFWELCKNKKGRYSIRKLQHKYHGTSSSHNRITRTKDTAQFSSQLHLVPRWVYPRSIVDAWMEELKAEEIRKRIAILRGWQTSCKAWKTH